ncbi:MAG: hypothetical protein QOG30_3205 [Acidimicrobiaceae bacterium]|jgi:hypothetical protein
MGIGTSLFLIATGAILDFAIHPTNTHGFDINTIGVILMVVGALGLVLSLIFWNSWGGFGGRRTYVEDGPVVRRTYRDEVV